MTKIDLIIWIDSAQGNLDKQGEQEFSGPYKKGTLAHMNKELLLTIKQELEGVLYSVGVRSEARMHRYFNGGMGGPYF